MITDKKKLRSLCDTKWFKILLKPKCEICPRPAVQVHHFYHKGSYGHLRYDMENGISLCKECHFALHSGGDAKKVEDRIEKVRGHEWREALKERAWNRPGGSFITVKYYNDILEKLNQYEKGGGIPSSNI